ncbi:MAG: polysaccharide biosynthesis protein [Erysipelotrichaceae bacterium]|nr:polysaccharide biosynthesis protein [Erysipelotrichaceae bacterium]
MNKLWQVLKSNKSMIVDLVSVFLAYFFSILVRFDFSLSEVDPQQFNAEHYLTLLVQQAWIIILVYLVIFKLLKLDKTIQGLASVYEATRVIIAAILGAVVYFLLTYTGWMPRLRFGIYPIQALLLIMFLEGTRFYARVSQSMNIRTKPTNDDELNTLILGAGAAGSLLLKEVSTNHSYKSRILGFIDDDPSKTGKVIGGIKVMGTMDKLNELVKKLEVQQIYVAMPSVSLQVQKAIIQECYNTGCKVKVLSSTQDMMSSSGIKNNLHDLNIEDLLGRNAISLDNSALHEFINDQVILITGAAGSIGSELARQVYAYQPKILLLIDINENGLYDLHQDFLMRKTSDQKTKLVPLIVNMRERSELEHLFEKYKPSMVIHAAAHKHVPLMEDMPSEAVKNNIFGSLNLIEIAKEYHVKRFVTISTDKAVNPTNVMGATKRFIEQIIQSIDPSTCDTKFMAVRFGNVLGSNGSIIPLFKRQIEAGGPLTLTHKDIIRYFMTIPEAVSLVLQAAVYAKGGEIFVLDMGKPVKILDLAKNLIRLAGYEPYVDIDIKEVGLRQGEKLFEELHLSKEEVESTPNQLIFITHPIAFDPKTVQKDIDTLRTVVDQDDQSIIEALMKTVPTYKPNRN